MADAINLDAYLARIGWQGEKAPTYKEVDSGGTHSRPYALKPGVR